MDGRVEFDIVVQPGSDPDRRYVSARATNRDLSSPAFRHWQPLEDWLRAEVPGYRLNCPVRRCGTCGGSGEVSWPWDDPSLGCTVTATGRCPDCRGIGIGTGNEEES